MVVDDGVDVELRRLVAAVCEARRQQIFLCVKGHGSTPLRAAILSQNLILESTEHRALEASTAAWWSMALWAFCGSAASRAAWIEARCARRL